MCGILGFSGENPSEETKLRWLFVENQDRGGHSTGIYTKKLNKKQDAGIFKTAENATDFIKNLEFSEIVKGAGIVGGHTRAATSGAVTAVNAHPFEFNYKGGTQVVGAHNGFISQELVSKATKNPLHKDLGFEKPFEVDSMLLFAFLSLNGGDFKRLNEVEGGIAAWFVMPLLYPNAIFLYKREARDLHLGFAREGIYFSSEKKPLEYIGCKGVTALVNNSITILDSGKIVDVCPIPAPKIIVPYNTTGTTFETRVGRSIIGQHFEVDESDVDYYGNPVYKNNNYCRITNSKIKNSYKPARVESSKTTSSFDRVVSIIKDVAQSIREMQAESVTFSKFSDSVVPELDGGFITFKLVSSTSKDLPLVGWSIFCDEHKEVVAGITALNGVCVVHIPSALCGKKLTLYLSDPLDQRKFSYAITPASERVQEVTLSIPFPSKEKGEATGDGCEEGSTSRDIAANYGRIASSELIANSSSLQRVVANTECYKGLLPEKAGQIPIRYSQEENDGIIQSGSEDNYLTRRDLTTLTHLRIPVPDVSKNRLSFILKKYKLHQKYPTQEVKTLRDGVVYDRAIAFWGSTPTYNQTLDLDALFGDACLCIISDTREYGQCHQIGYYATALLYHMGIFAYAKVGAKQSQIFEVSGMINDAYSKLDKANYAVYADLKKK